MSLKQKKIYLNLDLIYYAQTFKQVHFSGDTDFAHICPCMLLRADMMWLGVSKNLTMQL